MVPPCLPPEAGAVLDDDDALAEVDELDDELEPQAATTSAAMTVSNNTEAGLMCLFTDPPPQEVVSSQSHNLFADRL